MSTNSQLHNNSFEIAIFQPQENTPQHLPKKLLTNEQRHLIFQKVLKESNDGKVKQCLLAAIASEYSVHSRTIYRIWQRGVASYINGSPNGVSLNNVRSGRKRVQINFEEISRIPLRRRTNIRSLAKALNMPKSTTHKRIQEGALRRHSSALKPKLTEENMKTRVQFCLSMIEPWSLLSGQPTFTDMYQYIHIDEKWFYMTKEAQRYYLLPEEEDPHRCCQSKRFITKVMFLAAVARPRFDMLRNQEFSGKIGIFSFVYKEPSKRKSKNRPAGTLQTKPILSVTKEVIRSCLIENVLPAIHARWPLSTMEETILIQQDNAKPHISINDIEFHEASSRGGLNIQLVSQPPNSPDLNILDLGFFRAIQSLQHQEAPSTIDELVSSIEKAFWDYPSTMINRTFLTLQSCMLEVMKNNGGINYKIPHMSKGSLERNGNIPLSLSCPPELLDKANAFA